MESQSYLVCRRTIADESAGLGRVIGGHGMGRRNHNGEMLMEFLIMHGLFARNTAFQHASRHRTSGTGWLPDRTAPADSKRTVAVYNQIDCVLCKQEAKPLLRDPRSDGGATLNSDLKPVMMPRICLHLKASKTR